MKNNKSIYLGLKSKHSTGIYSETLEYRTEYSWNIEPNRTESNSTEFFQYFDRTELEKTSKY